MSARLPIKIDATSNGEFRPVPLGPVLRAARRLATHRITANPFCEIEVGVPFPLACLPIERVPSAGWCHIYCGVSAARRRCVENSTDRISRRTCCAGQYATKETGLAFRSSSRPRRGGDSYL